MAGLSVDAAKTDSPRSVSVTSCSGISVTVIEGTAGTITDVATLRLFARAREVAGTGSDTVTGCTVDEVIAGAIDRYGANFAEILTTCRVWVNGEEVPGSHPVGDRDEVAVLPPVSGGCGWGGSRKRWPAT
jgi:molybdopterin synthase sulfur carrier subunit